MHVVQRHLGNSEVRRILALEQIETATALIHNVHALQNLHNHGFPCRQLIEFIPLTYVL